MIIISDTTPIISLLKADQLELLQKLYQTVLVPRAVYRELTENLVYIKEAEIIKNVEFLSVGAIENIKSVNVLRSVTGLDEGESQIKVLANSYALATLVHAVSSPGTCVFSLSVLLIQ